MHKKIWKNAAACLLAALMLPGCSDDEGGGPDNPTDRYRTVVVSISSRNNAEPVGTRALNGPAEDDITTEEDEKYERTIDSWWLIILKQNNDTYTVERVLSSEGGTATDPEQYDSTVDDSAERYDTSIGVELEIDQNYRFYALANLDGLENATIVKNAINTLAKDASFDPASLNAQLKEMSAYHEEEGGNYIPMSSYGYDQYVDGTTDKLDKDIELIRLIGKVTLEVRNKTGQDLTLKSLKMGQFRSSGDVYLFPWDVNETTKLLLKETGKLNIEGDIPKFPTTLTEAEGFTATTFYNDETGVSIPQYNDTDGTGAKYYTYYVDETYNQTASDPELLISVETNPRRDDNEKPSGFSFVRRNDWLQIPIQITNVTTKIEIDQKHMPIGGLPESLTFDEISVPIAWCTTTHGGDITVNFALQSVTGMTGTPQLCIFNTGDTYTAGTEHYTSAILKSNGNDILIQTPADNTAAPWLEDVKAYTVSAGDAGTESIGQGSFTVTAQELAASTNGLAEIELRMVVTDGTQYMTIPYTIYISNQSN